MKRFKSVFTAYALCAGLLCGLFASCENSLVPAPTALSLSGMTRSAAPQGLSASNGLAGIIQLTWQPVNGASRYYIYGTDAATPKESDFKQVGQTTNTTIDIRVNPGSTAWYRVSAVDSAYTETKQSLAVRGSSLARPYITSIESTSNEKTGEICVKIDWYMANCNAGTYLSSIEYEVKYTNPQNETSSQVLRASELSATTLSITDLNPSTSYKFQVVARNIDFGSEEESAVLDKETLHRLRPAAPVELKATEGSDTSKVTLSFKLPQKADVCKTADNSYITYPLYFKVYRKEHSAADWPSTVYATISPDPENNNAYNPGEEITWDDTIDKPYRGVLYDYKVQSYVQLDDLVKNGEYSYIETSENSAGTTTGWAMKQAVLSVGTYTPVKEGDSYVSAEAGFNFVWDNFPSEITSANTASNYTFWLYEQKKGFGDTDVYGTQTFKEAFSSIASVSTCRRSFKMPDDNGYYKYTMYIVPKGSPAPAEGSTGAPSEALDSAATLNELIVTDNAQGIENFKVKSKYTDHFDISWDVNSGWTYTLTYIQTVDGISDGQTYVVDISTPGNVRDTGNISSEGVCRTYTLSAKPASGAPISSTAEPAYSLGTPAPIFDEANPSYDSISIKWKKVDAASSYKVQFPFPGNDAVNVVLPAEGIVGNVTVSEDSIGHEYYTYTFSKDELGSYYKDATTSGDDRIVKVTAASEAESNNQAEGSVTARTIGPGNTDLKTSVSEYEKKIVSTWNAVPGAAGYIVKRMRYTMRDKTAVKPDKPAFEFFYVDASTLEVSVNDGEKISCMTAEQSGNKITLTDEYAAAPVDNAAVWQVTQSRIPWGIPVEYAVIPVADSSDKMDKEGILNYAGASSSEKLAYTNLDSIAKKGCTFGYGLNVRASKSEYSGKVIVTWDMPYGNAADVSHLRPFIYRRKKGRTTGYKDADLVGSNITDPKAQEANVDSFRTIDELTGPYEYVVKYISTAPDVDKNDPFVSSYIDTLKETRDAIFDTDEWKAKSGEWEPANVGYLFYLPELSVTGLDSLGNESFTESVYWKTWDYEPRLLGPADDGDTPAYTIWTKNLNNASGWFQVGSMDTNGVVKSVSRDWDKTSITPGTNSLALTPTGLTDSTGCNNGLLKVQRDQKHYYMIRAQRKNEAGETIYTYLGLDGSIWTYRKISAEEFTKNVLVIVADALAQAGIAESDRTCTGYNGSGPFKTNRAGGSTKFTYGTSSNNFRHNFYELPGFAYDEKDGKPKPFTSDYTISMPDKGEYGVIMYSPYYFEETTITVSHASGRPSYQGSIKFTAGKKLGFWTISADKTYSFTADTTTSSGVSKVFNADKNQNTFESFFPVNLGESYHDKVTHKDQNAGGVQYNDSWWGGVQVQDDGSWRLVQKDSKPDSEFTEQGD